jgi:L-fuculose-phosphate aldolase
MNRQIAPVCQDRRELREEIIRTCLFLRDRLGYFVGTWGNISVRVEEGLLVTPSRMSYDALTPEDLVVVGWERGVVRGRRMPTSEMELHRRVLRQRVDMGALVHSHSPWASVCACAHRSIPVLTDDMAEVIGGEAQAAAETIGPEACAVLLGNHGVVAGGRDLGEAVVACQFVEKAALILIQAEAVGGARPIAEEAWREERHRYLYKYGRPEDLSGMI